MAILEWMFNTRVGTYFMLTDLTDCETPVMFTQRFIWADKVYLGIFVVTYLQGWFIFPTNFSKLLWVKCKATHSRSSNRSVKALYKEEQVSLNFSWRLSQWSSWSWLCLLLVVSSDTLLTEPLTVLICTAVCFTLKQSPVLCLKTMQHFENQRLNFSITVDVKTAS